MSELVEIKNPETWRFIKTKEQIFIVHIGTCGINEVLIKTPYSL